MKRIIKRLLTNIAFMLMLIAIFCGIILGASLLQLLFHYLSAIFNPFMGLVLTTLVFVLVVGVFFTAIDEYHDRE